jgi:apolipoprotein N-acyltransferase
MTRFAPAKSAPDSTPATDRQDAFTRHQLIAGLVSGVLLWTSFPPLQWSLLAWVALAPLFWLATLRPVRAKTYLSAWGGGLIFWLLAVSWVRVIDPGAWLGWVTMALVLSLWWPAFVALTRWAMFRLHIPLMLAAPIIWVGLEYARAYFMSGFPWYYLAHSQFRSLYVIQIADFASSLGISFLIALTNACLVDLFTLPLFQASRAGRPTFSVRQYIRMGLVSSLLLATLSYGVFRVSTARFREGPKLALLQSNIEQRRKEKSDPWPIMEAFEKLVVRALSRRERPDLIVWPETAYPFGYISVAPDISPNVLEKQVRSISSKWSAPEWLKRRDDISLALHSWTDNARVPMLVGSIFYHHKPNGLDRYNSALLIEPNAPEIHVYHKMHLVPFGEYVPFIETLPWLARLTPYQGDRIPSLSFGREPVSLRLGPYRLAVSVCFEDTIPQVIARFFRSVAQGEKPDALINLSNDGSFRGSSELEMHLAVGVFRAVEHRVPLARAVNTGLSALVDGNGEIRDALPQNSEGVLSVTVPLDDRTSCYSRWGDWLGSSALAVTVGLVPLGLFWKPRVRKRQSQTKLRNSPS